MEVEISQHQFTVCQTANGQFCNVYAPLQLLANSPSCITALYAKNTASVSTRCSFQVRKTQSISIPSSIAPNVWILTSAPSTVTTARTLIFPGETNKIYHSTLNPSTSCDYCQIALLHHNTFIFTTIV